MTSELTPPISGHSTPATATNRAGIAYRPEVDGLRALAVLPVLLFHGGVPGFGGGFVGVDVFFVISGYLITSIILADRQRGRFSLTGFYERRARRILPALFVVVAVSIPLAWRWSLPHELREFALSIGSVAVFASNLLFWRESGYFADAAQLKPLLHTWSLAVEEQYYLFFPPLLLLLLRWQARRVLPALLLACAVSLALAQWASKYEPIADFYLLPTRGWEILLGALIGVHLFGRADALPAHLRRQGLREGLAAVGLVMLALSVWWFHPGQPLPSLESLLPTGGTACLLLFADSRTRTGRLLASAPLVGIGLVSYSAYLWHQPLLAFARQRANNELDLYTVLLLLGAALLLAALSYRYVEQPIRDRRRVTRATVFRGSAIGMAAMLGCAWAGYASRGYPTRFDVRVDQLETFTEQTRESMRENRCILSDTAAAPTRCVLGARRLPAAALWGDSHAASLAGELADAFAQRNLSFIEFTKNECPAALGIEVRESLGEDLRCDQFNAAVLQQIRAAHIKTVILESIWQLYPRGIGYDNGEGGIDHSRLVARSLSPGNAIADEAVLQAYARTVRTLLDDGDTVILIYPVPEVGWNVPTWLAKRDAFQPRQQSLSTDYRRYLARTQAVFATFDSLGDAPRLLRIRPDRMLCNLYLPGRCAAELNGDPLYYDTNHLAPRAARWVAEAVGAALAGIDTQAGAMTRAGTQ
jgi:peptidoglycan/LPS O-acetylase OafA/YrhL